MAFETVTFERDGAVALLTLNRPEKLNAINKRMVSEVNEVLDEAEADNGLRALVLTGAGRAFSAGFDLKEDAAADLKGVADWRPILERDFRVIMRFWEFPRPTIAAVRGYCIAGGCELAIACDITIAAEGTMFGEPEVRFGSGFVALLMPWLTGPKQAKELLLTGNDRVPAEEAKAMGLINRVVPKGEELETAMALARDIAALDAEAVATVKRAINRTYDRMGMRDSLRSALDMDVLLEASETPDQRKFADLIRREGLKQAIAWRDSRFKGRGRAKG